MHMLSAAEIDRASAFVFEVDRRRFVARRSVVRDLLATLHECLPSELALNVNAFGKPSVTLSPFVFNTSSCGDSLLVAIGRRSQVGEIGVDLETMRPMPDALLIAQSFFSGEEFSKLQSLSGDKLLPAFFNCWTRKEAFVKAVGMGLSFDLNRFSVTLLENEEVLVLQLDGEKSNWHLQKLYLSQRHVAALASQFDPGEIRIHQL